MSKELYTVKEFAAAVGVSPQAVYKQLDKKLAIYVTEVDGKKMLKKEALEVFDPQPDIQQVEQPSQQNDQLLSTLKTTIEALQKQLEAKDKQINKLSDLLEQSQENLKLEKQSAILERQKVFELEAAIDDTTEQQNQDEPEPPQKNWWKFWK